ncbi:MAG: AAA family ATPase [Candidatus Hodarchaeales archaeon]
MKDPLRDLFLSKNKTIQLYGQPGSLKTTFLLHIIENMLQLKNKSIYLIDPTGNFPFIRLKAIKHLLNKLVVFQPKNIKELALLLDDLEIQLLDKDSILLIDDIFRHVRTDDNKNSHLNSYILAIIKSISKIIEFPVVITNQVRAYDNLIHPFLKDLTLYYIDWHFLFENNTKKNTLSVSFFKQGKFVICKEYLIASDGFISNL